MCPGVGRALPASASEPRGWEAVCVGAYGVDFRFVPGRLIAGMSGMRAWVGPAENKWAQVRSRSPLVE